MAEPRMVSYAVSCLTAGTHNLYTCPPNCKSKVSLVFFANANGNNTVSLLWYRKVDNDSYYIIGGKNMSVGEYVQLSQAYIVLEPEDRLDIALTTSGHIDALCTAEELFTVNTTRA